ncbi:MAG: undecaprenyldiphospho-muramoylpentapeptide beta-N-acetylglucosaminyltransferase [Betaproteobacteria bacterium]|nr:undecaprenyldiphospho-muramoylpentapeptide beta-N-acetylglucosaminyltransferase [Betaproteobacteria bacterium]MDH5285728.1 undecaprenyldiphospho-muramoylpentapeptide beta-N-acetylglucosaminyltransferase [Betaproteobacteria bacterium]
MAIVMITTGGTGGHIFPGLAVAAELLRRGARVFWMGTSDGMEAQLVPRHGVDFEGIAFGSVRGKGLKRLLLGPYSIARACRQAWGVIGRRAPGVVVGFGGFASFPGALMGVARNLPLVVHNLDARAGLANRVLRFGADRVLTGFPGVLGEGSDRRVEWVGNPLRADIEAVPPPQARYGARTGPLRLLVVGGSLGAAALNETVPAALALLPAVARPIVAHQSGAKHIDALRGAYARAGVEAECVAFIDDMAARYAEADLVVCRSGATTVAELAAVGVASLLVPFPYAADDHQVDNAAQLARHGAAEMWLQRDFTPRRLADRLAAIDRPQLAAMAARARGLRKAGATQRVADVCLELARR